MASPKSYLSWEESSEENISVETDPNWGREYDTEDEEIMAMFDLQIDLQDELIENFFPSSSDEESLDDADLDPDFDDVHGPFSRMWIFVISDW
jgi:hypothetical protein